MGHSLQLKSKKDNRFKTQCLEKVFPINLRMAFLVKYLAFVVAFLSAAKLGEGIDVKQVDPTDAESIQEYADMVKESRCERFDPLESSHMDAIGDDAPTLARLLTLHHQGDTFEICASNEEDRWSSWKTVCSIGKPLLNTAVKLAPAAIGALGAMG